jgi:hypothetical protein
MRCKIGSRAGPKTRKDHYLTRIEVNDAVERTAIVASVGRFRPRLLGVILISILPFLDPRDCVRQFDGKVQEIIVEKPIKLKRWIESHGRHPREQAIRRQCHGSR